MTINNAAAFAAQFGDWSCLDNCFGDTKIKVTDVDGFVERNGQFLMIEAKGDDVPVPVGQRILHDNWLRKGNSLLVIWGNPGDPHRIEFYARGNKKPEVHDPASISALQTVVHGWFEAVNRQAA